LVEGVNKLNPFPLFKLVHLGSIFWIAFTEKEKISNADEIDADSMKYFRSLHHSLLEQGVYLGPSGYEVGFISAAHSYEDLDKTIKAFEISLKSLV
jgi:glutamate-1-semialdehyde 2,1-aminomutase